MFNSVLPSNFSDTEDLAYLSGGQAFVMSAGYGGPYY